MRRSLLGTLLAPALAFSLAVPAFAAESAWQSAYTSVINQKASHWGNIIQLVDLDTDGTPELLIGGVPGSSQLKLEGSTTLRTGAGYYANATFNYWRSGSTIGQTSTFTKDVSGNTTTYSVGGQKVSASKYNSSYQNRHNGCSKV